MCEYVEFNIQLDTVISGMSLCYSTDNQTYNMQDQHIQSGNVSGLF